jgi:hypothetical protein
MGLPQQICEPCKAFAWTTKAFPRTTKDFGTKEKVFSRIGKDFGDVQ